MTTHRIEDREIAALMTQEKIRQQTTLSLIASENYISGDLQEAEGSCLTNKYAEGYPHKRYYAGCSVVDQIELIAQERCKKLFHAEHANVQPHAGSQANSAVYSALLSPGDTILGMDLAAGGHLTHGSSVSSSGKFYKAVSYGVDKESELINYEEIAQKAHETRPRLIIAGASAYSRAINFKQFAQIAASVDAYLVADIAHIAGLVATGLHESPVGVADCVTSTTHKTLAGPRGAFILSRAEHAEKIDRAVMPGIQGGPMMHTIAAKALAFAHAGTEEFKLYQKQILANATTLCNALIHAGYTIVSGGTDTHLFIINITKTGLTGLRAEQLLETVGITVSRSTIPFDTQKPYYGSGIRVGVPAATTRGMKEGEMLLLAECIDAVLKNPDTLSVHHDVFKRVQKLCASFPIPTR